MDARNLRQKARDLGPWQTRFDIGGQTIGGSYDVGENDLLIREFLTRLPPDSRILELGCMEGGRTVHLARHVNHVVAVDGRRRHLNRARFVQELLDLDNITFLEANLETFDVESLGRFDAIYNVGLLYHLPEPWVLLRKLARVAPSMYLWTHVAASDLRQVVRGGYRGVVFTERTDDLVGGLSPLSFRPTADDLCRMLHNTGWRFDLVRSNGTERVLWCRSRFCRTRRHMPGPKRFSDVAVITTCHNYGRFLGTAIRSVLAQTHPAVDILVVDDASDDETPDVAKKFADDGVRYLRVEHRNAHLSRKAGVDNTTAEVVLFLDADNALNDDYLERGLAEFTDRNVAVVYADLQRFGLENGRTSFPDTFSRAELLRSNFVDAGSLIRRDALTVSDVWDRVPDCVTIPEDCYMFQQIAKAGWQFRKQTSRILYRTHHDQKHRRSHSARQESGYFVSQGLVFQDVTLFMALAGRPHVWHEMREFLARQTWPHEQLRLILCDTGQQPDFTRQLREWVTDCDYPNVHHFQLSPARPGLADEDRRNHIVEREVQEAMCRIYNRLRQSVETDYCWIMEDDVIPPDDALERLMRHFNADVGSVHAPYPSRWDPDFVVWDYQRADSPGVHRIKPPAPDEPQLQEIRGSGFGCVVLRSELLRRHVFSIPPGELYYDPYFFETMGDEWKRLCDWTCICRHLTER